MSIFKRDQSEKLAASPALSVQQVRTRARRRLIGATILILMGIAGFPLLFESQPRPIAVDIPIEIPRADNAAPLNIPAARTQVIVVEPPVTAPPPSTLERPASAAAPQDAVNPEKSVPDKPATASARPSAGTSTSSEPPAGNSQSAPRVTAPSNAETKATSTDAKARAAADSSRARALLEGRDTKVAEPAAKTFRFVVQVGAFADATAAKEARLVVEKLGLKTYTQVIDTSAGNRTRVRVGPLESREKAEKVQARLKAAGLAAVVLTL